MILTLTGIASALGGRIRGNKVVAPGPEAVSHKVRWKRKRQTLTVWINAEGDIGERSQFLSEALRIAHDRLRITCEQFALVANDLKNVCSDAMVDMRVHDYAR